jgi:hypothetical protein
MNGNRITLPDYSRGKFVNRTEEIELVRNKVERLLHGLPVERRTTAFVSAKGNGKSWLKNRLTEICKEEISIACMVIDLQTWANTEPATAIWEILDHVNHQLNTGQPLRGFTLVERSRSFMDNCRQILQQKPTILLVDTVYESERELLALLDSYLLKPFIRQPRTLIVLFGRGRPFPWTEPALRLRQTADFVTMGPFDKDYTNEQIGNRGGTVSTNPDDDIDIYELGGGNPLANDCLIAAMSRNPGISIDEALKVAIEYMLEPIPESQRELVSMHLEALSILRAFDEERITLLAQYFESDNSKNWSERDSRQVRADLVALSLASWDEEQGAYIMDSTLRPIVENYLRQAQPDKWAALHQTALGLYEEWTKAYPRSAERWRAEAEYHRAKLGGEANDDNQ